MATNSLLPNYLISSFPSVRLYSPHHNIVCLFPQTNPSTQKDKIPKLFSSLHLPLHTILLTISPLLCRQKLSPTPDTAIARLPLSYLLSSPAKTPSSKSPCLPLHASKPPFFINASRSLIIIWSRPSRLHTHSVQPSQILNQVVLPMQM